MKRTSLPLLAACLLLPFAASGAALEPAPATIILTDGSQVANAWVTSETIDQVEFILGDPKGAHPVASTKPRSKYVRVDYTAAEDPSFQRGEVLRVQKEADKAIEQYRKALTTAKYQWELVSSSVALADLLGRQKKVDEALAALKELTDRFPTTVKLPEATWRRADLKLAKGDNDGAAADYALLAKNAEAWGSPEGGMRGILGQAQVLRAAKKFPEAAAFLAAALGRIKVDEDPTAWANIGLAMAGDLIAAGKADDGLAALRHVAYAPVAVESQCRAHLEWARQLAAAGKLTVAFDHAVLAAKLGSNEREVEMAGDKLAREISAKIDKDSTISNEDRAEYRKYLGAL
ncbi:MAG: tetratricopeptide repeat protein [Planctomycetes bacterium]|nr:tetratricopeptide repeat protein [Planctomycetota bacterium]